MILSVPQERAKSLEGWMKLSVLHKDEKNYSHVITLVTFSSLFRLHNSTFTEDFHILYVPEIFGQIIAFH